MGTYSGSVVTIENCQDEICPGSIRPGDICPTSLNNEVTDMIWFLGPSITGHNCPSVLDPYFLVQNFFKHHVIF